MVALRVGVVRNRTPTDMPAYDSPLYIGGNDKCSFMPEIYFAWKRLLFYYLIRVNCFAMLLSVNLRDIKDIKMHPETWDGFVKGRWVKQLLSVNYQYVNISTLLRERGGGRICLTYCSLGCYATMQEGGFNLKRKYIWNSLHEVRKLKFIESAWKQKEKQGSPPTHALTKGISEAKDRNPTKKRHYYYYLEWCKTLERPWTGLWTKLEIPPPRPNAHTL